MNKSQRFFRKERKLLDAKDVSINSMLKHSGINFIYGFLAGAVPTAISLGSKAGIFFSALSYYICLSVVLNRKPYVTRLGKYLLFPISSSLGLFLSYILIKNLL